MYQNPHVRHDASTEATLTRAGSLQCIALGVLFVASLGLIPSRQHQHHHASEEGICAYALSVDHTTENSVVPTFTVLFTKPHTAKSGR